MNHKHLFFILPTIIIFFIFCFLTQPAHCQKPGQGLMEAPVEVAPVIEKEVQGKISIVGTVEAEISTAIASQESGLVKQIQVEEGDWVKKGQLLATLDSTGLKFNLKASQAELREARVQYEQAKRDFERYQALVTKNIIAEQKFEEIELRKQEAAQKIERLEALTAELSDRLEKTRVYSPVSGYVVQKEAQVGEWIAEGGTVVTVAVLNPVKIMVPLPEIYIRRISKGQKVSITLDALPDRSYEGRVSAIIPKADPQARTFPIKVNVNNPKNEIKAGMLARVVLAVGERRRAILVPKDAIVLSDTGNLVYIVSKGTAAPVPVKTGLAYDSFVEVAQGLRPGQKVVVKGNERLMPGTKVKVLNNLVRKSQP